MGIDAEMFVRQRGQALTQEEALEASYWMCAALGTNNFFVEDKGHHALSIVTAWDEDYYEELKGKVVWTQDGLHIEAEPGEQFIRVHLLTRYYGPGYERGNWMLLRTTIEWLKCRWPDSAVWYGGA